MTCSSHFLKKITSIISNSSLAGDIYESLSAGLSARFIKLAKGHSPWDVFKFSLERCVRDIEADPRVELFRRLLLRGPATPAEPAGFSGDGTTTLSDEECERCVEFVFSRMVNGFKGELAELLAVGALVDLVRSLRRSRQLPRDVQVYWCDAIEERRRIRTSTGAVVWGSFCKGADGLVVQQTRRQIVVLGIVEVKSMRMPLKQIANQVRHRHTARLKGGLRLLGKEWPPTRLSLSIQGAMKVRPGLFSVAVFPSSWKLSRERKVVEGASSGRVVTFYPDKPPQVVAYVQAVRPQVPTIFECIGGRNWKITLSWSQEALAQASFEMTFWYMAQVGAQIYNSRTLPKTWEEMSPEEAGQNAIKQSLYFILARPLSRHAYIRALRLYNVYAFGFPLGVDADTILDARI